MRCRFLPRRIALMHPRRRIRPLSGPAAVRLASGIAVLVALAGLLGPVGPLPGASALAAPAVKLTQVLSGFNGPTLLTNAGDGSNRLFVLERAGLIKVVVGGQVQSTPFLDIRSAVTSSGLEQGLLGLAFHPNYPSDNRFFVFYTAANSAGGVGDNTLARYRVSGDPNRAEPGSAAVLFAIPDPYANHNGGMLAFGPDRYLYVATGDAGSGGDPENNGQNRNVLLGKILRLDVDNGSPYGIPTNNPFVGQPNTKPEIWAYGLRNPWRFSFDRQSGDLWIGDVGQGSWEEVNREPGGGPGGRNYGWKIMEGAHCFGSPSCNQAGLTLPVAEYDHSLGCSVTAGYVYRGAGIPDLRGAYVFGDYCSGRIWSLRLESGNWVRAQLLDSSLSISSFGEDEAGELHVVDIGSGSIFRLDNAGAPPPPPPPANRPPLAAASGSPTSGPAPLAVQLSSAGSSDPDGDPLSYTWDFGDGTPTSNAANPRHTYSANGNYTATLTVGDGRGGTANATVAVTVASSSGARPDLVITAFSADSAASDRPVPVRVTVRNRGTTGTSQPFDVHIWADRTSPPTTATTSRFIGHLSFNALAAGATATLSGSLLAGELQAGPHTLSALVDAHGLVGESNEGNNTRSANVTVTTGSAPGSERLRNPGFEDRLAGWASPSQFAGVADVETSVVHSGARSFRFRGNQAGPFLRQDVAAAAGETITVSGWVNVANRKANMNGRIELLAMNANGRVLATHQVYAFSAVTSGWTQVSAARTLPAGTAVARLRVQFPRLNGTVYLDDFSITVGSVGDSREPGIPALATSLDGIAFEAVSGSGRRR